MMLVSTMKILKEKKLIDSHSPTNGNDHVKTSIKFGNQYGWGEQLNCLIFITLFSYFSMAAKKKINDSVSIGFWKCMVHQDTQV